MFYVFLADVTVFIHFLWILFLISGAFIGRRYKWVKKMHIFGILFAVVIQIFGWYCPLTYLEIWLRRMHSPSGGYAGSFIINYVEKLVYMELSAGMLFIMTILLVLMSVFVYLYKSR